MSADEFNDETQADAGDAPGAELHDELSGGDASFVVGEEKKPLNRTTLVLFMILALGGGGLYLMHLRTGPKNAAAAPQAEKASQTITQFLSSGDTSMKSVEKMLKNTQKIVQQFLAYPSVNQVPLSDLKTNPFRQTSAKDGESANEAEARRKREEDKAAIRRAVDGLTLQSILHGARRACMINNTMVTEGQQIDGFVVEKINPSSVIIKQSGFRFEIQMQK